MLSRIQWPGMISEFDLIEMLARASRRARGGANGVVVGIGDDAAVLRFSARDHVVVTTDSLVEGRHFRRGWLTPREMGWRLAAANLSDIAAMGAEPKFALVSLVLPRAVSSKQAEAIQRGAVEHLGRFGASVVGGNVTSTDGPLVLDMTLIGTCARGAAWKRRARKGDAIVVAGTIGSAAAGVAALKKGKSGAAAVIRAYKRPTARVDVARVLSGNAAVHGAIDISDGLSSDLIHICEASGVGCEVDAVALPIPRTVRAFCSARRIDPVRFALHAGEDYALLLSVAPQRAKEVCRTIRNAGAPAAVIGIFTGSAGVYGILEKGRVHSFRAQGWDHFKR